jgi:hypothetical protein
MAKLDVEIRDTLKDRLQKAACLRGVSEGAVVEQVLENLLSDDSPVRPEVVPAQITDPEEVAAIRRAVAGMWKDRTDLPDFAALRREGDERLARLFRE